MTINSMVSSHIVLLTPDDYFDDYDFEDRPILVESPRLNEFDTNTYFSYFGSKLIDKDCLR
jgi:hypothetical protein